MEKTYKHKAEIKIILESNNFPKMQRMAHKYFSVETTKEENNPDDIDNFVCISKVLK